VLCITGFLGFEGSITASEESVNPRGVLPKVLFGAVIITGIFYVVTNYAGVVGYGLPSMSKIANDPLPWNTIANHYWGNGWGILVDIGAWISMFACAIAGMNASSRLWFAMGRENVLPAWLGVVKTERCVPLNAIYLETVITLIFGVGLGLLLGPFPCFLFLGILLSIGALIVWILAGISLIRFMYTKRRDEFRVIPHVIVPILSIIFVIPPLYSTVWPIPESPLNYALYLAVVWIVVGLILLWRLTVNNPGAIAQAGKIMVED
jgi:amino acid transporter